MRGTAHGVPSTRHQSRHHSNPLMPLRAEHYQCCFISLKHSCRLAHPAPPRHRSGRPCLTDLDSLGHVPTQVLASRRAALLAREADTQRRITELGGLPADALSDKYVGKSRKALHKQLEKVNAELAK
eukprot:366510-Chlamydomonas_euryale.AAC.16